MVRSREPVGHQQVEAQGRWCGGRKLRRVACGVVRKVHVQTPSPPRAGDGREWTAGAKRSPYGAVSADRVVGGAGVPLVASRDVRG
jgi:hypothetical protein